MLCVYIDITSEEMILRTSEQPVSRFERFYQSLVNLLSVPRENVEVFTVQDSPDQDRTVNVRFAAHGSPYYTPARMNGLVWANKDQV